MIIGKTLVIMAGKEIAEYLIVNQGLKLIGRGAKGRTKNMTISFDQIRNIVAQNKGVGMVAPVLNKATSKVVSTAKSVGSAVRGTLPVTYGQHVNDREAMVRMIATNTLAIEEMRSTMGFPAFVPNKTDVDAITSSLLAAMDAKPAKEQAVTAPVEVSKPAMVEITPVSIRPLEQSGVTDAMVANEFAPKNTADLSAEIPLSRPSNWHLA